MRAGSATGNGMAQSIPSSKKKDQKRTYMTGVVFATSPDERVDRKYMVRERQ
jgi:hypothetical protein